MRANATRSGETFSSPVAGTPMGDPSKEFLSSLSPLQPPEKSPAQKPPQSDPSPSPLRQRPPPITPLKNIANPNPHTRFPPTPPPTHPHFLDLACYRQT